LKSLNWLKVSERI